MYLPMLFINRRLVCTYTFTSTLGRYLPHHANPDQHELPVDKDELHLLNLHIALARPICPVTFPRPWKVTGQMVRLQCSAQRQVNLCKFLQIIYANLFIGTFYLFLDTQL